MPGIVYAQYMVPPPSPSAPALPTFSFKLASPFFHNNSCTRIFPYGRAGRARYAKQGETIRRAGAEAARPPPNPGAHPTSPRPRSASPRGRARPRAEY